MMKKEYSEPTITISVFDRAFICTISANILPDTIERNGVTYSVYKDSVDFNELTEFHQ